MEEQRMISEGGVGEILWENVQYTGREQIQGKHKSSLCMKGMMKKLYWILYFEDEKGKLIDGPANMFQKAKFVRNGEDLIPWTPNVYFSQDKNIYSYDFGEGPGINLKSGDMDLSIVLKPETVLIAQRNMYKIIMETHGIFSNLMTLGGGKIDLI
jgi:hypothetical protein